MYYRELFMTSEKIYLKEVRFDYYQVFLKTLNITEFTESIFDLSSILEPLLSLDARSTTHFIKNGDEVRVQKISKLPCQDRMTNESYNVWKLQILRIRKGLVGGIAKDNGDFNSLALNEDEGLGEDIAVVYDDKVGVIGIQRNRNSVSPGGVIEYFSEVCGDMMPAKSKLIIKPIPDYRNDSFSGDETIYRKISFDFARMNWSNIHNDKRSKALLELSKVKDLFPEFKFKVEISVGNKFGRDKSLPNDEIELMLENLQSEDNKNNIEALKLSYKRDAECKVEHIDLIEQRDFDAFGFKYTRREPIKYNDIMEQLFVFITGRHAEFMRTLRDTL